MTKTKLDLILMEMKIKFATKIGKTSKLHHLFKYVLKMYSDLSLGNGKSFIVAS